MVLRGVPRKRCSESMQQIFKQTPMPKCDFNKLAFSGGHPFSWKPFSLVEGFRFSGGRSFKKNRFLLVEAIPF